MPNVENAKSDTATCCDNGQPSLSLISDNNVHDGDGALNMMKPRRLRNAVYWLSKDGFLQCETWPFTLQFMAFWKSVDLWRNLGLVLQHYWKRSFEERMWRSKFVLDVYKGFG